MDWSIFHLRDLPWRRTRDPWAVLVSEVMLQQTQVARVEPRWVKFLDRFPDPAACADSGAGAVIEEWSGLGYNRRGLNLWNAAAQIVRDHDGVVPDDLGALLALPGIGPYTARAVLVFAFEHDVGVVDTNVGRLLARWTGERLTPTTAQSLADRTTPPGQAWRWWQTVFDFAVAVCDKRDPACAQCPVRTGCAWQGSGPDPAVGSAGVSTGQARFEGSTRQVRGRIVELLRAGPKTLTELSDDDVAGGGAHDVERIVDTLVDEGLAQVDGATIRLP